MEGARKSKILIVDDAEINRIILREILGDTYEIAEAANGYEAIASMIHGQLPDLVLLDIMMPEMDGFEVIAIMKNNPETARIPIIFATASGQADYEVRGLGLGATDYITKPFLAEAVKLRVNNCIELGRYRADLERKVEESVETLAKTRENMLLLLADVAEHRDVDAAEHVKRTGQVVERIIEELRNVPHFREELDAQHYQEIPRAAYMHDIGKIAISDAILLKPGKLTDEEFEQVKLHTTIGGEIIDRVMAGSDDIHCKHCKDICLYHHERWDGRGYPMGLKGQEIPLSARIVSVVDVYDALISRRPYKEPFRSEEALRIISEGSGTQFDPEIVAAMDRMITANREVDVKS